MKSWTEGETKWRCILAACIFSLLFLHLSLHLYSLLRIYNPIHLLQLVVRAVISTQSLTHSLIQLSSAQLSRSVKPLLLIQPHALSIPVLLRLVSSHAVLGEHPWSGQAPQRVQPSTLSIAVGWWLIVTGWQCIGYIVLFEINGDHSSRSPLPAFNIKTKRKNGSWKPRENARKKRRERESKIAIHLSASLSFSPTLLLRQSLSSYLYQKSWVTTNLPTYSYQPQWLKDKYTCVHVLNIRMYVRHLGLSDLCPTTNGGQGWMLSKNLKDGILSESILINLSVLYVEIFVLLPLRKPTLLVLLYP